MVTTENSIYVSDKAKQKLNNLCRMQVLKMIRLISCMRVGVVGGGCSGTEL